MADRALPPRPDPLGPAFGLPAPPALGRGDEPAIAQNPSDAQPSPRVSSDALPIQKVGAFRRFFQRHPRWIDVFIMVIFAIPGLLTVMLVAVLGAVADDPSLLPDPSDAERGSLEFTMRDIAVELTPVHILLLLLSIVIMTVALWWRRDQPVVVFAIASAFAFITALTPLGSGGFEWAMAFAIYAVATLRNPRIALYWALGASGLVMLAGSVASVAVLAAPIYSFLGFGTATGIFNFAASAATFIFQLIPVLIALAIGSSVYNRRHYVASLVERTKQLQLERDQREQLAVVGERVRIARELHDVTAHSLTVMVTLAEGASRIAQKDPARAAGVMQEVAETGRTALADTRRVVGGLREDSIDGQGIPALPGAAGAADENVPLAPAPTAGVESLVASFRSAGLPVTFTQQGPPLPEIAGLRLAVYRIVQEALTNVLRYAASTPRIEVSIAVGPTSVEVTVTNENGTSLAPPAVTGSGRGLIGMRERVAVLGGTLQAGAIEGSWRIAAQLPIPGKDDTA